jgi:hypothetical protein
MGQGFFGYNPPQFVLDAAHDALGKVECNQYSPTKVWCHGSMLYIPAITN